MELETLSVETTHWAVIDIGCAVGSTKAEQTIQSVQDRFVTERAARIVDSSELLRSNEYDATRLDLLEPAGKLDAVALGYVLSDHGTAVFAGIDFHASPLHAIDQNGAAKRMDLISNNTLFPHHWFTQ